VKGTTHAEEEYMPSATHARAQQNAGERTCYWIRPPWREPTWFFVGVTPRGFEIEGGIVAELKGRVIKTCFVRKLFIRGTLLCYAPDAICACEGIYCDGCGHKKCRTYLRIQLAIDAEIYTLDLGIKSAVSLLRIEHEALAAGQFIIDVPLKLTVVNQDDGGEVCFERV
jgi:hypothetical protein